MLIPGAAFIVVMAAQPSHQWCYLGRSVAAVQPWGHPSSAARSPDILVEGHGCQQEAEGCPCTCTWGSCQFRLRKVCSQQLLKEGRDFRWHFNTLLCRAIFRQYCCQSYQMLCVFWVFTELHNKRFSALAYNGSVICWKSYCFEWPLIWRSIH